MDPGTDAAPRTGHATVRATALHAIVASCAQGHADHHGHQNAQLLVAYNDGKNVATAQTKVVAPTYGVYAVLLRTAKGATRYWARAAAQAGRRAAPGVMGVGMGKVLTNSAKELELGVLLVVQHVRGLMVHRGHDVNVLGMLWAAHALVGRIFQEGCGWGKMIKKSAVFFLLF